MRISSIGILRDITEIQNFFEELKAEKNRLNDVLNLANIIFMVIDDKNKIRLINEYGCKILGYEKNDLLRYINRKNF